MTNPRKLAAFPEVALRTVSVRAPARLHLGFLDLEATLGRRFGSIGLAIDEPVTSITLRNRALGAQEAKTDGLVMTVAGDAEQDRARTCLKQTLQAAAERHAARPTFDPILHQAFELAVEQAIPAHAGLGSGTQLTAAITSAVAALVDQSDAPHKGSVQGRGARSGIGLAAFEQGGILIDGGRRRDQTTAAPIISRLPFPPDWRIILVLDRSEHGVHGTAEQNAFANLQAMSQATAAHLCHLTLMQLLPAAAEHDLIAFGTAVEEIQERVGAIFAPHQGGQRWSSPRVHARLRALQRAGAVGLGQSSWGPTGFAFAANQADAEAMIAAADKQSDAPAADDLETRIVRGRNEGAQRVITTNASPAEA
ncbi:MAG: beta-ribofuranosylaminobenzene 5'-phosphate synthase family protein [Pseudomonadota bacterium]